MPRQKSKTTGSKTNRKRTARPRFARNSTGVGSEIDHLATLAKSGDAAALDSFVALIQPTIRRLAAQKYGRTPKRNKRQRGGELFLGIDDLAQEGLMAAICCLPRYDPSSGFRFMTFARHRILGAMGDAQRKADHLSRTQRQQATAAGGSGPLLATFSDVEAMRAHPNLAGGGRIDAFDPADYRENPLDRMQADESFLAMTDRPDPRYTTAFRMYFGYDGSTMNQAAAAIGVSESCVSQWFSASLPKIGQERIAQELIGNR